MGLLTLVTLLNVMISLGFALLGVVHPQAILPVGLSATPAAMTFALYAFTRSLVLAGCVVAAAVGRRESELWLLGVIGALIQIADAAVGAFLADVGKTIGPLAVAALQVGVLLVSRGDQCQRNA